MLDGVADQKALAGARQDVEAHHGHAGVDADPHLLLPAGDARQVGDAVAQPQRGVHGPLGVVFVGGRHTEDADHGVADVLLDDAAEDLDGAAGQAVELAQEAVDVLRVGRFAEPGEIDEVAEHRRHDLALDGVWSGSGQGGAATRAEPRALGALGGTRRAGGHRRRPPRHVITGSCRAHRHSLRELVPPDSTARGVRGRRRTHWSRARARPARARRRVRRPAGAQGESGGARPRPCRPPITRHG